MSEKRCLKCGVVKPLDEFYAHPQMADGHLNKCKECAKQDVRQNYVDHLARHQDYERRRSSTPERKKQRSEYQKARRSKYPEKERAHGTVAKAVASGKLVPNPCEICGDTSVQAHHDDYSRPTDVRWLCFRHHREVHGQKVVATNLKSPTYKAA